MTATLYADAIEESNLLFELLDQHEQNLRAIAYLAWLDRERPPYDYLAVVHGIGREQELEFGLRQKLRVVPESVLRPPNSTVAGELVEWGYRTVYATPDDGIAGLVDPLVRRSVKKAEL